MCFYNKFYLGHVKWALYLSRGLGTTIFYYFLLYYFRLRQQILGKYNEMSNNKYIKLTQNEKKMFLVLSNNNSICSRRRKIPRILMKHMYVNVFLLQENYIKIRPCPKNIEYFCFFYCPRRFHYFFVYFWQKASV